MPISDLAELLRSMQPVLNPRTYAFCVVPDGSDTTRFSPRNSLTGSPTTACSRQRAG